MQEKKLYPLNLSQKVVALQCKYTLFKRVINILTSATFDEKIDDGLMETAFRKVVERNDSMRISFVKKGGSIMQYFRDKVDFTIPRIEFKTKEEQEAFILKIRKHPIAYTKGVVFETYFCKTFDGKFMLLMKVCHLILDMYGINTIFKDICEVYNSLKSNAELPSQPTSFEEIVKKDLVIEGDVKNFERKKAFITEYLKSHESPYYAGLHGSNQPIWQKQLRKNKRSMKMFFIRNDTKGYKFSLDKNIVKSATEFCEQNKITLPKLLFYAMSVTASKINGNVKNMLPLELCNCRATIPEKKCAGTKVQTMACYTVVDGKKSFIDSLKEFSAQQDLLYRYIGFPDQEYVMLLHKIYNSSVIDTFFSICFSFVPVDYTKGVSFDVYSNGKCALPAYIALLWDYKSNAMDVCYDVQTRLISEENINTFHTCYENVLKNALEDVNKLIENIGC